MYSHFDTLLIEEALKEFEGFKVTFLMSDIAFRRICQQINFYSNLFARTFPNSNLKIKIASKPQTFLIAPTNY